MTIIPVLALTLACDERTAEEKGRDYAEEKVGFAQGAADVLKERGKDVGESVGTGVGDLIKGTGSAVKDVVHPPVKVNVGESLSGVEVLDAHEGADGAATRNIVVRMAFKEAYEGRLELRAIGEDGKETARAQTDENVKQAAGGNETITFGYGKDVRLSKIESYTLEPLSAKTLAVDGGLAKAGIEVSQLKESGSTISVYAVFTKPYKGGLQLRAFDGTGAEIGRSEATEKLTQASDSASHISFDFDTRTPLSTAASYTLHKAKPKPKAK